MELKLQLCESCGHIIYISETDDVVFPCPLCGCLNEIKPYESEGQLVLTSPNIFCKETKGNKDTVTIDMDDDVKSSIKTLLDNGWTIKFIV